MQMIPTPAKLPEEAVYVVVNKNATAFERTGRIIRPVDLNTRPAMFDYMGKQERFALKFCVSGALRERMVRKLEEMGFSLSWYWYDADTARGVAVRA